MASTRSQTQLYLVESTISDICGSRRPTRSQVLRFFLYCHGQQKMNIKEAANEVFRKVSHFWERAQIPMKADHHARDKIITLYEEWTSLKKNRTRRTTTQKKNEETFAASLSRLFDIAHENASSLITIKEDRQFLQAQREDIPRGSMAGIDKTLSNKEERKTQRENQVHKRRALASDRREMEETVELVSSSSSSSTSSRVRHDSKTIEGDAQSEPTHSSPVLPSSSKRCRGTVQIMSPEMTAAMDRAKLSNRAGVHIIATMASTLGHDPADLSLNRESIRRRRRTLRVEIAEDIKKSFKPTVPLTVHWDGKLVPDSRDPRHKRVERLPVLVTGEEVGKLLAVPRLPAGSGDAIAKAVVDALENWGVDKQVVAMSFDTTASNTGRLAGACPKIQERLGRPLLWLACRHHILELVLAKAFSVTFGPSNGPEIALFRRFEEQWDFIDR